MKRFAKYIPTILSVLVCAILASLIFFPNFNKSENVSDDIFAESISVVTESISMDINSTLHFISSPYTVEPADCNQKVNTTILDNNGNLNPYATYSDGYFVAEKVGTYYLRFFVNNAYDGYAKKSVKIDVVDDNSLSNYIKLKQPIKTIYQHDIADLKSMVEFVNDTDCSCLFKLNDNYLESNFSASVGSYNIDAVMRFEHYEFITPISVNIKGSSTIKMTIKDDDGNKLNNTSINLPITDNQATFEINELNTSSQQFAIISSNDSVVSVASFNLPYLVLNLNGVGTAFVTIHSTATNNTITLNINIIEGNNHESDNNSTSLENNVNANNNPNGNTNVDNSTNNESEDNNNEQENSTNNGNTLQSTPVNPDSSIEDENTIDGIENEDIDNSVKNETNNDCIKDNDDSNINDDTHEEEVVVMPSLEIKADDITLADKQLIILNIEDECYRLNLNTTNMNNHQIVIGLSDDSKAYYEVEDSIVTIFLTDIGVVELTISVTNTDISYTFYLEITKNETILDFELRDMSSNLLVDGDTLYVNLSDKIMVLTITSQYVNNQDISINISDESVCSIINTSLPMMFLTLHKTGTFTLTVQNTTTLSATAINVVVQ